MEQETNTPEVQTPTNVTPKNSYHYQISKGVVVGLIIFGVIFITAIYVALSGVSIPKAGESQLPTVNTLVADTATAELSVQGTSDDVADIEKDLNSTDLSSLNDIDNI